MTISHLTNVNADIDEEVATLISPEMTENLLEINRKVVDNLLPMTLSQILPLVPPEGQRSSADCHVANLMREGGYFVRAGEEIDVHWAVC